MIRSRGKEERRRTTARRRAALLPALLLLLFVRVEESKALRLLGGGGAGGGIRVLLRGGGRLDALSSAEAGGVAAAPSAPVGGLAPVQLRLAEVKNVRDMAGVQGSGIRAGRVFRTGYLSRASPSDIELLKEQGLQTLVDLRSQKEIAEDEHINSAVYSGFQDVNMDKTSPVGEGWEVLRDVEGGRRRYFVSLMDESIYRKGVFKRLRKRHKAKVLAAMPILQLSRRVYASTKGLFMRKINDGGLFLLNELLLEYSGAGLARVLKLLAEPARHPVALYCTAGKDRTGLVMALALAAIGVSDDEILDDYVKSDSAYRDLNDKKAMVGALEQIDLDPDRFLCAPREVMMATLKIIRDRYGDVNTYLDGIGFGPSWRERLKRALTED